MDLPSLPFILLPASLTECFVHFYAQPGITLKNSFHSKGRAAMGLCPWNSPALPHILLLVSILKHFTGPTLFHLGEHMPCLTLLLTASFLPRSLQLKGVKEIGCTGASSTQFTAQPRARKPCNPRHKPFGMTACLVKASPSSKVFGPTPILLYSWRHEPRKGKWLAQKNMAERVTALPLPAPQPAPEVKQARI